MVGLTVDGTESTSLLLVKSARGHIYILSLHFQFATPPIPSPPHRSLEKHSPDSLATKGRVHAHVPHRDDVVPSLRFVHPIGIVSQQAAPNTVLEVVRSQQSPSTNIPSFTPPRRALPSDFVIVLDPRVSNRALNQLSRDRIVALDDK